LLRGLAEDLPLHNWLCDAIWPLEAAYAQNDGYDAARLTILEMLKTGTTCFLDPMLTHRAGFGNVCKAVGEMGIRACLVFVYIFITIVKEILADTFVNLASGKTGKIYRDKSTTIYNRS
jgi:cytosine/adenosine deaminase-related metal-dependent hydrolase